MASTPSIQKLLEINRAALVASHVTNENADALKTLAAAQDKVLSLEINKNANRLAMRALLTQGQGHFAHPKEQLQKFVNALDRTMKTFTPKSPSKEIDVTPTPTNKRS